MRGSTHTLARLAEDAFERHGDRESLHFEGVWHRSRAEDATAHALRDGWLRTGDVGTIDAGGCTTIVDRINDVILRGGFNVYPRDVELPHTPVGKLDRKALRALL